MIEGLADAGEGGLRLVLLPLETNWDELNWGAKGDLRGDTHTQSGCLFEAEVFRDLQLDIPLGGDVFGKSTVLRPDGVAAVREARDAVSLLEALGDLASNLLYHAGVIWVEVRAGCLTIGEGGGALNQTT